MIRSLLLFAALAAGTLAMAENPETLAIGSPAPDFRLKGIDGKIHSLSDFSGAQVLCIIFTANHCPTAQAYEKRIIGLSADYSPDQMQVVAISSNSTKGVCLEELGYSDLNDSYEDMKIRAKDAGFNFPYLYDGDDQRTALAYGPTATPHAFIFDRDRILRYTGRIDDMENPYLEPTSLDARNAIDALLAGKPVPLEKTKSFGCSMKWISKAEWKAKLDEEWCNRPVEVKEIGVAGIKTLMENPGRKYRLINIWATWCGPCIIEFPNIVEMQRMYGNRNFEVVSLSMDSYSKREDVLEFLDERNAAFTNYLYNSDNKYEMIETVDPDWSGNLPYTILLAPGGGIVYRHDGIIDPLEVRKAIISRLGRYFADDR
jgi:thiol-disulfide isomerase/thioredoxin